MQTVQFIQQQCTVCDSDRLTAPRVLAKMDSGAFLASSARSTTTGLPFLLVWIYIYIIKYNVNKWAHCFTGEDTGMSHVDDSQAVWILADHFGLGI